MPDRPRLARSTDHLIAGVCGGIAEFLGWKSTVVRVLYVFASIVSAAFPGIAAYLILWWLMPPPTERRFRLDDFRAQ